MNTNTLYLLTGAAGFLGTNICAQLLDRGDRVRAFVLKGDPARKYIPEAVEVFEGDLCCPEDCERFFEVPEGTDTVCIHCASMVTIDPSYSEKLIAVNVGGTENMLAAAKQMERSATRKGTKPVLTEFAVYNLERNNHFDCSKARNELGFAPRPYAETLHDTAAWLKASGKLN